LETDKRNKKLYLAVNATAWIPINIYVVVLLNFFLRPGQYILCARIDELLLWFCSHLSMLSLLYLAVTTFKYYFNRQGRLGGVLGRLSYNVYIIHIVVMGPIALFLLDTDLPALVKYPILALATYVASNLLVYAYTRTVERVTAKPDAAISRQVVICGPPGGLSDGDSTPTRPAAASRRSA
jgi:peptidoglycan/LPS O-acetylase OafA/YrhL